jgi:hypothetical protein
MSYYTVQFFDGSKKTVIANSNIKAMRIASALRHCEDKIDDLRIALVTKGKNV